MMKSVSAKANTSSSLPIFAYEVSPQWPDGGGAPVAIGAATIAIITAAAALVFLTLSRTIHHANANLPESERHELFNGGRSKPLSISFESFYAVSREATILSG